MGRIKLPVRELVAWNFCTGDLQRSSGRPVKRTEGYAGHQAVRDHRRTQPVTAGEYRAEVAVKGIRRVQELEVEVVGRIDGLYLREGKVILEEVKTTTAVPAALSEQSHPAYWAQAICYAALYMSSQALPSLTVQLTYFFTNTQDFHSFSKDYTASEAEEIFLRLLENLAGWLRERQHRQTLRDAFLDRLAFPFEEFRPGQPDIIRALEQAVTAGQTLYIQAPTGIGKTLAVLYPALKALGAGQIRKIFFLTAKTTGSLAAEAALRLLAGKATVIKSVNVTAREKMCPYGACDDSVCRYALGYYDRLEAALREAGSLGILSQAGLLQLAESHLLCPFEFALDLAREADVVIGDYNYLFDPRVRLRRFFETDAKQAFLFLIDEAHNLPERAREMYSAVLRKEDWLQVKESLKTAGYAKSGLYRVVNAVLNLFQKEAVRYRSAGAPENRYVSQVLPAAFLSPLQAYLAESEACLGRAEPSVLLTGADVERVHELYFETAHFLAMAAQYADNYVTSFELTGRQTARLSLFCVDPAPQLQACIHRGNATVFFSGSLFPLPYYRRLLGDDAQSVSLELASPFAEEQRLVLVTGDVSTLFNRREQSCSRLAKYIKALTGARHGNYLVFFPAYTYLRQVLAPYLGMAGTGEVLVQQPVSTEAEKKALLDRLGEGPGKTVFAVAGGVFGESIDLPGELLSGAMAVGVTLPQLNWEQEILRRYFDEYEGEGKGFLYAYVYPGFKRVVQAAGRVIRSTTDKGIILLADQRFLEPPYLYLLEKTFPDYTIVHSPNEAGESIRRFWEDSAAREPGFPSV